METARCCTDRVFYSTLLTFLALGGTPGDSLMLHRPCILQYIINFPGSRTNSWRPLDVAQTVYVTIHYSLSLLSEELLETARCCSDRVLYSTLSTFLALGGSPGDSSMLLRPCILQYISNFPGSQRNSWRQLDVAQTVYFTIPY